MQQKAPEDHELLAALQQGDDNAFDQAFRSYFPSLCFFAFQFTHDEQAAEDIVQDSFLKLWRLRKNLKNVTSLKGYLYSIVRNQCMEWLQNNPPVAGEPAKNIPADQTTEQHIIRSETIREIHRVVQLLPPRMKQVFTLYYLEGRSTKEISELLQTSIETVRHQRKSALQFFRKQFIPC